MADDLAPQERLVLEHLRQVVGVGVAVGKAPLGVTLGLPRASVTKALNGLRRKGVVASRRSRHVALNDGRPVWFVKDGGGDG